MDKIHPLEIESKKPNHDRLLWIGLILLALLSGYLTVQLEGIYFLLLPGAIFAIVFLLLSLRHPHLPFFILIAIFPFEGLVKVPGLPDPHMIALAGLTMLSVGFRYVYKGTMPLFHRVATVLVLVIGIWTTISAIRSGDLVSARSYWLVIILFILTINLLRTRKDFIYFSWVLILSLSVLAGIIIYQQMTLLIKTGFSISAQALHGYANDNLSLGTSAQNLSIWIGKGVPFAYYLSRKSIEPNHLRRNLLLVCMILMILGVSATVSLTGVFGLVVTFVLIILFAKRGRERLYLLFLGIVGAVVILFSPIGERIQSQIVRGQDDIYSFGTNRVTTWYVTYRLFLDEPFIGVGPGRNNIWDASLKYVPAEILEARLAAGKGEGVEAHNAYLSIAAELGLPGLLVFLALLTLVVLSLWRITQGVQYGNEDMQRRNIGMALLIALLTYAAQGLGNDIHLEKIFWLLLGAGIAYILTFRPWIAQLAWGDEKSNNLRV